MDKRRWINRLFFYGTMGIVLLGGVVLAEEAAYRRVFVTPEMVDALPTGGKTYWPVKAEEFERWAKRRTGETSSTVGHGGVVCESSRYTGVFRASGVLEGSAELVLKSYGTQGDAKPTDILPWSFGKTSFALDNLYGIRQTNAGGAEQTPAIRDISVFQDDSRELMLFRSDFPDTRCRLVFRWSQRAEAEVPGQRVFTFAFLPSNDIVMEVAFPKGWTPKLDHGLVERLEESDLLAEGDGERWRFRFGGNRSVRLTLLLPEAEQPAAAPLLANERTVYRLDNRGMDVTGQYLLDLLSDRLDNVPKTLPVRVGQTLLLTAARFNGASVSWRRDEANEDLLILEIPDLWKSRDNTLELTAMRKKGAAWKGSHPLPLLELPDVRWSTGTLRVEVMEPLELLDVSTTDAQILSSGRMAEASGMELEIRKFVSAAGVRLSLRQGEPTIRIDMATAVDFQENEIVAQTELTAQIQGGECFELWGVVDRSWAIDAVEASVPGVIDDWNLDTQPEVVRQFLEENAEAARNLPVGWNRESLCLLRIHLAHSLRPERGISLEIRSRRLEYTQNLRFSARSLTPVFFPSCQVGESWLMAGTMFLWRLGFLEPYRPLDMFLENGSEKPETTFSATLNRARALFPANVSFLVASQDFRDLPMLQVERRPRAFQAVVEGFYDLTVSPRAVFKIRCNPQGSMVDRVRVQIRPATLAGTSWKFPKNLLGSEAKCLERKSFSEGDHPNDTSELWEISLRNPRQEPFEFELVLLSEEMLIPKRQAGNEKKNPSSGNPVRIREWWTSHFPEGLGLPLVNLPDAQTGTGTVTCRRDVADDISIETHEMTPVLSVPSPGENLVSTDGCWTYRYAPLSLSNTMAPYWKLCWRATGGEAMSSWIWNQEVQTQFFPGGASLHVVTLNVENLGHDALTVTLPGLTPDEISLFGVIVNGQRLANVSLTEESGEPSIRILLPPWKRHDEVIVQWICRESVLGVSSRRQPPEIQTSIPVLQRSWKVWIPENYVTLNTLRMEGDDSIPLRIFGRIRPGRNIFTPTMPQKNTILSPEDSVRETETVDYRQPLALMAISDEAGLSRTAVGWRRCEMDDPAPLWLINSNAMEASRWMVMLFVFLICMNWLAKNRPLRLGLCGIAAVLAMVVPLVISPIFSGIFLGILASFAVHSIQRYRKRVERNRRAMIHILGGADRK
ncbi:MAG: hypothetical protein Q4D98_09085 [Planctomycetia bacterium]|nr:hypothetical protein [Planctomycetia bacterium]